MFKQWLFSAALLASSIVAPTIAAATTKYHTVKTIRPFTAELVFYETNIPYDTVLGRLDAAINKTGSVNFLRDFHNSKTKEEQTTLISSIIQDRTFLLFLETNHKAWLDVYDPTTQHPKATVYTIGNPNFAANILPLDYTTGVNIPPRFLILETKNGGAKIVYQQFSKIFAPFNKNKELAGHTHDLDVNFGALFDNVTSTKV
ncbi:hypothetical protein BDZ94DRAFT_1231936 [Collybia nuda]|uniref:DUF302 domain-containing protein n=1 Tax=Collybia nuda TaxID=64659 RepID=A0A9P5YHU0_9AGAR|nr:hypothetical protein BDZ94DRAFT_1231936 [Collybia nuda]